MKVIKEQIIAGTRLDAHGEKIAKETLQELFDQIPEEMVLHQQHDFSRPPIAKAYNKRFVEVPGGEFVIKVDVEVWDEERMKEMGGFSIAYSAERLTLNDSRKGDVEILFNPLVFNREDMVSLIKTSNTSVQIDAVEVKQKALEALVILTLTFTSLAFLNGFLGKFGADAYDALKGKLRELAERRKAKKESRLVFQLMFPVKLAEGTVHVLIEVFPEDLDVIRQRDLSIESALENIITTASHGMIQRAVFRVQKNEPYLVLIYLVDLEGNVLHE